MVADVTVPADARIVDVTEFYRAANRIKGTPEIKCVATGIFTPGLYTRTLEMPSGSGHVSKVHKTEHQFIISKGACYVKENGGEAQLYVAPYHGITKPGTWRELIIIMDCIWTTMHPTDKKTVDEVEADIIQSMEDIPQ